MVQPPTSNPGIIGNIYRLILFMEDILHPTCHQQMIQLPCRFTLFLFGFWGQFSQYDCVGGISKYFCEIKGFPMKSMKCMKRVGENIGHDSKFRNPLKSSSFFSWMQPLKRTDYSVCDPLRMRFGGLFRYSSSLIYFAKKTNTTNHGNLRYPPQCHHPNK